MYDRWVYFQAWWLHSSVGGGLLLLLTWWLMQRCRQPARRQRLGEWGMVAALVFAVLSLGPKWLFVPVAGSTAADARSTLSDLPGEEEAPRPAPVARAERITETSGFLGTSTWVRESPVAMLDHLMTVPALVYGPVPTSHLDLAAPQPPDEPKTDAPVQDEARSLFSWPALLMVLSAAWALGAIILSGRWLLGHYALRYILSQAEMPAPGISRLFAAMTLHGQRPRLLVSRRLRVPISCGIWRPTVVIPTSLCDPRQVERLRWVFAHELTHLERRDAWASLLFGLGQAVYFVLPWFWWLRRHVRLCQEYVADAAAAEHTSRVEDYAQFLLSLSAMPAAPVPATGVVGNSSDLFRRVTMLLQAPQRVEKGCPQWWSLVSAAGLLALAVLGSGIGVKAMAAPTPEDEEKIIVVTPGKDGEQKAEITKKRVILMTSDGKVLTPEVIGQDGKAEKKVIVVSPTQKGDKSGTTVEERFIVVSPAQKGEKGEKREVEIKVIAPDGIKKGEMKLQLSTPTIIKAPGKGETKVWLAQPDAGKKGELKLQFVTPESMKNKGEFKWSVQAPEGSKKGEGKAIQYRFTTVSDEDDKKPAPKKEGTKKEGSWNFNWNFDIDSVLKNLPDSVDKEQIRREVEKAIEQARKAIETAKKEAEKAARDKAPEARQALEQAMKALQRQENKIPAEALNRLRSLELRNSGLATTEAGQGRLGVNVDQPSAALADQLDLPQGRGLVVTAVRPDSPAAKAGLKVSDVLLEVAGKPVTNEAEELVKQVKELKAGSSFSVVVLRKGKKETIRGVTLPDSTTKARVAPKAPVAKVIKEPVKTEVKVEAPTGRRSVVTTTSRSDDSFTTRHQEGPLSITVAGKISDGKSEVSGITIRDGGKTNKYESLDSVPEQYREKVRNLVEMNEKSNIKIEKAIPKDKKPARTKPKDKDAEEEEEIRRIERDA